MLLSIRRHAFRIGTQHLDDLFRSSRCSATTLPRNNTFNYQSHHFCGFATTSIKGVIIGTYKTDGFGSQWKPYLQWLLRKQNLVLGSPSNQEAQKRSEESACSEDFCMDPPHKRPHTPNIPTNHGFWNPCCLGPSKRM